MYLVSAGCNLYSIISSRFKTKVGEDEEKFSSLFVYANKYIIVFYFSNLIHRVLLVLDIYPAENKKSKHWSYFRMKIQMFVLFI